MKYSSINQLGERKWYRLLKVIYVIILCTTWLSIAFFQYEDNYTSKLSQLNLKKSKITCNYGNKKTVTLEDAPIYIMSSDFGKDSIRLEDYQSNALSDFCNLQSSDYKKLIEDNGLPADIKNSSDVSQNWKVFDAFVKEIDAEKNLAYQPARDTELRTLFGINLINFDKFDLLPKTFGRIFLFWTATYLVLEISKRIIYFIIIGKIFPPKT